MEYIYPEFEQGRIMKRELLLALRDYSYAALQLRYQGFPDGSLERKPGEIELCRFKLKEGAALRTNYKDFYDMQTEYDTLNLADATWSSAGGNTLSKEITDFFAKKVLECGHAEKDDIQFAYFLLQSREAVNYDILDAIRRGGGMQREKGNGWGDGMIVWE